MPNHGRKSETSATRTALPVIWSTRDSRCRSRLKGAGAGAVDADADADADVDVVTASPPLVPGQRVSRDGSGARPGVGERMGTGGGYEDARGLALSEPPSSRGVNTSTGTAVAVLGAGGGSSRKASSVESWRSADVTCSGEPQVSQNWSSTPPLWPWAHRGCRSSPHSPQKADPGGTL